MIPYYDEISRTYEMKGLINVDEVAVRIDRR